MADIYLLDKSLNIVDVIDLYETCIWSERYRKAGDFELHVPSQFFNYYHIASGSYLRRTDTDVVMIIEEIERTSDADEGDHVVIKGHSLQYLLDRRVVWTVTVIEGNLQDGVEKLLNENVINPTDTDRAIPGFIFKCSTDTAITNLMLDAQFLGESLYEVICAICEAYAIGFRVNLTDNNEFEFELYAGVDRSYSQETNPYVVFSPKYDNLLSSDYYQSDAESKNVVRVAGEGDGADRMLVTHGVATGLERKEMFYDGSSISKTVRDDQGRSRELTDEEYASQLTSKGEEELAQYLYGSYLLSAEVESSRQFIYGTDFKMGDIVQVEDRYGVRGQYRIIEMIRSHDTSGDTAMPTFEALREEI